MDSGTYSRLSWHPPLPPPLPLLTNVRSSQQVMYLLQPYDFSLEYHARVAVVVDGVASGSCPVSLGSALLLLTLQERVPVPSHTHTHLHMQMQDAACHLQVWQTGSPSYSPLPLAVGLPVFPCRATRSRMYAPIRPPCRVTQHSPSGTANGRRHCAQPMERAQAEKIKKKRKRRRRD